jgi:hypothetical protein
MIKRTICIENVYFLTCRNRHIISGSRLVRINDCSCKPVKILSNRNTITYVAQNALYILYNTFCIMVPTNLYWDGKFRMRWLHAI